MRIPLAMLFLVGPNIVAACSSQALIEPLKGQILHDRQPTLRWEGRNGDTYRVQLAALLPEARILASYDVAVNGTQFKLPTPLPAERAAIKVLISHGCDELDAQDLHAQGAWFFVDVRDACSIDRRSFDYRNGQLTWRAVPAAGSYKVRLFKAERESAVAAIPLQEMSLERAAVTLPRFDRQGQHDYQVVSVQPVCEGRPGRVAAFRLLPD